MYEKELNTVRSANISATKVTDRNRQTANTRDTTLRSEVTVTRKIMILAVIGSMLLSTLISVIAGIHVYHLIIDKMADSCTQDQDRASTTFFQYQTDVLIVTVKEIQANLTAASDVWNEEMMSLKTFVSEIERHLTAATDAWNEEMESLKTNVSELERNLTAATDIWNEEMISLKTNVSELERNLTAARDVRNEPIARNYSKDCSELYAAGTVVDGVHTISPDGGYPFHVYCDMTGGGWTLIQKRLDGLVNFNRYWQAYAEGFGNIDGDHWLGLENIHRLTANSSEIYFHFEYYNGTIGFAHYLAFSVHGANTTYRMNIDVSGYNGTIIEKFKYHNNMMFTTYDRDNDKNKNGNCATKYQGGWWFRDCYRLGNLNGVYGTTKSVGISYHHSSWNAYLKSVNIKVKPSPGHY